MESKGFSQRIEEGMYEQGGKLSCIDLIFTNRSRNIQGCGNVVTGTSHNLVYGDRESKYKRRVSEVRRRVMKNFCMEVLVEEASKENWENPVENMNTVEELDKAVDELGKQIRKH
jgi:hypothetical protein